jgi:hypothetical protein
MYVKNKETSLHLKNKLKYKLLHHLNHLFNKNLNFIISWQIWRPIIHHKKPFRIIHISELLIIKITNKNQVSKNTLPLILLKL